MRKRTVWKRVCCVCLICLLAIAGAKIPIGQSTDTGEMNAEELQDLLLYPGGMPFGIKFYTEGVTVVGICEVETSSG